MSHHERILAEQAFHDRQAARRATAGVRSTDTLVFSDEIYLEHETWIRPAFERLGSLNGKRTLDFGCGHGMAAVVMARRGADVTAFDVSRGYLEEARLRAKANRVHVRFVKADGEKLPFADATFDRVWGNAILHHLDVGQAGREIHRVLASGGIAVFCEPWGENRLLSWARRRVRYADKDRTADERPLTKRQLDVLENVFPSIEVRGFQLFSMARRVLRHSKLIAGLDWCDDLLLRRVPQLQRYCRYVVITVRKDF